MNPNSSALKLTCFTTALVGALWVAAALVTTAAATAVLIALGMVAGITGLFARELHMAERRGYEPRSARPAPTATQIRPPERLPYAA